MKVKIDIINEVGEVVSTEVDVDISLDSLTMREAVLVEDILGEERFVRVIDGDVRSPAVIQAVLFAKLKTQMPDLELDGFDVDLEALIVPEQKVADKGKV